MQIKVIYSLIDNMVNFKDKNMPAVIDKATDFIGVWMYQRQHQVRWMKARRRESLNI